jgi:two-component system, OmpR family, KDP operon response regulator KdpE
VGIFMGRGPSVLIIDDDPAIRRMLRRGMIAAGYQAEDMAPGEGALERVAERRFDLLILDIDLPGSTGLAAIRIARDRSPVPIVALSVRDDEDATVDALNSGADDYIRKPFGIKEFLARARNALRRRARERGKPALIVTGDLEIDLLHRRVRSRGHDVHISAKRYEVLRVLAEGAGKALTHKEILRAVWGARGADRVEYLRNAIQELRRKLEADPAHPRHILTETRVGYRLDVRQGPEERGPFCDPPSNIRRD